MHSIGTRSSECLKMEMIRVRFYDLTESESLPTDSIVDTIPWDSVNNYIFNKRYDLKIQTKYRLKVTIQGVVNGESSLIGFGAQNYSYVFTTGIDSISYSPTMKPRYMKLNASFDVQDTAVRIIKFIIDGGMSDTTWVMPLAIVPDTISAEFAIDVDRYWSATEYPTSYRFNASFLKADSIILYTGTTGDIKISPVADTVFNIGLKAVQSQTLGFNLNLSIDSIHTVAVMVAVE